MATIAKGRLAGHWTVEVFLGRDLEGRSKRRKVTVCPQGCAEPRHRTFRRVGTGRKALDRVAREIEDELRQRMGTGTITLAHVVERWLDTGKHATTTRTGYESRLALRILPTFGTRAVHEITTRDIAEYRDYWADRLSPRSVNHDLAIISGALKYALEQGWITAMPAVPKRATQGATQGQMPAEHDIAAVLAHLSDRDAPHADHTVAIALALACATGARRGEIVVRRWTDIATRDIDGITLGEMLIHSAYDPEHGEKLPKSRQGRTVPLQPGIVKALASWRQRVAPSPWVLPSTRDMSAHIHPDTISHRIGQIVAAHKDRTAPCDVCGRVVLGRVWMHGGRHFAASKMVQSGIDIATAAEVLGHSTPMVTAAIYAHGETDTRRAAIESIPTFELPAGI